LALTKLDVLDEFATIRVCTGYDIDGRRIDRLPDDTETQMRAKPVYTEMQGWQRSTTACRSLDGLPAAARRYVDMLAEQVGVPVRTISVGADRDSTFRTGAKPRSA